MCLFSHEFLEQRLGNFNIFDMAISINIMVRLFYNSRMDNRLLKMLLSRYLNISDLRLVSWLGGHFNVASSWLLDIHWLLVVWLLDVAWLRLKTRLVTRLLIHWLPHVVGLLIHGLGSIVWAVEAFLRWYIVV